MKRERKAFSRDERQRMIIYLLADDKRRYSRHGMTCAQIANGLKVTPSTKLRDILNDLVVKGLLDCHKEDDAGIAGFKLVYTLSTSNPAFEYAQHYVEVEKKRELILNAYGHQERLVL